MRLDYIVEEKDSHIRLDDYLKRQGLSRKLIKKCRQEELILLNDVFHYMNTLVLPGDHIVVTLPKETSSVIPIDIPINIIYEDDYLLVIDKQSGLPTIPNKMYYDYSLGNALMYYYKINGIDAGIHFVNRLDKETSGLLLVAKNRYIHHYFSKDIKQITRIYHAYVSGHPKQGTIIKSISHDENHPTKRKIDENGQYAITHYHTVKEYDDRSLIECHLETGRTHQIRVHLSSIGHPLIGDDLYGGIEGEFYLDSISLSFIHPITHQSMTFTKNLE